MNELKKLPSRYVHTISYLPYIFFLLLWFLQISLVLVLVRNEIVNKIRTFFPWFIFVRTLSYNLHISSCSLWSYTFFSVHTIFSTQISTYNLCRFRRIRALLAQIARQCSQNQNTNTFAWLSYTFQCEW